MLLVSCMIFRFDAGAYSDYSPCNEGPLYLSHLLNRFFADEERELDCEKCHHTQGKVKVINFSIGSQFLTFVIS